VFTAAGHGEDSKPLIMNRQQSPIYDWFLLEIVDLIFSNWKAGKLKLG